MQQPLVALLHVQKKLTQDVKFRQALISHAQKHGVTKAAIRYKTNRQYVYRWKRRYDAVPRIFKRQVQPSQTSSKRA